MYINTFSSKGRDILKSNIVTLEVNDNNQLILSPVCDLGGTFSIYRKDSEPSFDEIRQQAWLDNTSIKHKTSLRGGIADEAIQESN